MADATWRRSFLRGMTDSGAFVLVVVPFGMVYGVIATEAGLSLAQVMGFSVFVIAGASQVAAVQLMTEGAAVAAVLAASLVINLRMAMYSAALAPHLGPLPLAHRALVAYFLVDQTYAASALDYERNPTQGPVEKVAYFWGSVVPVCLPWYGASLAGALLGRGLPPGLGLDFAVPITFLALIAAMLRTPAHWVAAGVSVAMALALAWLPAGLGLIVAALAAMAAGAAVETWTDRRTLRRAGA